MNINQVKEGGKVQYIGENESQKGIHKVLETNADMVVLDSFYSNAKYFIIDKHNLDKIKLVKD